LCFALRELNMAFTADAVEHSDVTESGSELSFAAPPEYCLMITETDIRKALARLGAKPYRIKVTAGNSPASGSARAATQERDDEVSRRALSHPEVQRFQQLFPSSHVRQVRNLKE
jgi:hypothetical protein